MAQFSMHKVKNEVHALLRKRQHRTARVTAVIVLILGVAFSVTAPPLWGLDEVAHLNRVLEISNGKIVPPGGTINVPSNLRALEYTVYMDLDDNKMTDLFSGRKDVSYADSYKTLGAQKFSRTLEPSPITATYSPVSYIGPLIGVSVAKIFELTISSTIFLARLGGLLSYVALVYIAVATLDKYRLKMLIAVIALLPVSVFQASTINADTLNIGVSLVFISLLLRLVLDGREGPTDKRMLICLAIAAMLLPLIKINNVVLLPLVLFIPRTVFATKAQATTHKMASTILPIAVVLLWTMLVPITTGISSASPRQDGLMIDPAGQLHLLVTHPMHLVSATIVSVLTQSDSYLGTMTTTLGWNVATLPSVVTLLSVALFIGAGVYAKKDVKNSKVVKNIFPVVGLAAAASAFAAMYVTFNPVGFSRVDGVQGRYFIPYLPLLLCSLAWAPFDIIFTRKNICRLFLGSAVVLLSVCYIGYVLILY